MSPRPLGATTPRARRTPPATYRAGLTGARVRARTDTGAVCVYPDRVAEACAFLQGSGIPVASVATGFPAGQIKHEHKLAEIRQAVADGAMEIDIVIPRKHALTGEWGALYREVRDFRKACGAAELKTILATGELPTLADVYTASMVCMMAGADFIKTSTGKEKVNATLEVSLVMCRAIRVRSHKPLHDPLPKRDAPPRARMPPAPARAPRHCG